MNSSYQEVIEKNIVIRTIRDENDINRYVNFHTTYEDPIWGKTSDRLIHHHPEIFYSDFLFVEDKDRGEILSTCCLIPWHCLYEDIQLKVAMLELVYTHPKHRNKGYIRKQINRFHKMVKQRGYDLSIIGGIPYYYRQFGYAYAFNNGSYDSLPHWSIPFLEGDKHLSLKLRPAVLEDIPILAQLYDQSMSSIQFSVYRDLKYWEFLLRWMNYPIHVVEDYETKQVVGYISSLKTNKGIKILESAISTREVGDFILYELQKMKNEIQLGWQQNNLLVQIARCFNSTQVPVYQWLLRISDYESLLSKIIPVLNHRLKTSVLNNYTADVCINLFRETLILKMEKGKVIKVNSAGFIDTSVGAIEAGGDLLIPPDAFVRLIFGYRKLDELRDAWPDIRIKPEKRYLIEALFPKMTSSICMPWKYYE